VKKRLLIIVLLSATVLSYFAFERSLEQKARQKHDADVLKKISEPIYLNIENTSRAVTPLELGFSYTGGVLSVDKNKLTPYLDELEKEFSFIGENPVISFDDFTFRLPKTGSKVVLDRSMFDNDEKRMLFLEDPSIDLNLDTNVEGSFYTSAKEIEKKIGTITAPLLIKYGRNSVHIPTDTLLSFITVQTDLDGAYGKIDVEKINEYVRILSKKYENEDVKVVENYAAEAIARTLLFRVTGYPINNAVILPIEGRSKTNGELHDAYLEVIKSQQRLYRFENGKLTKTYIVSTGLTWETPPGEYSVMGKQKMTISYFGNWYMPNYLPIGYVNGSYRFGFHSIPYHMDAAGNIYSRDFNTMGSPATGGCIQLTPEDSLELFNWAWVGLPVYIYE
jgi:hypothetical protein